MVQRCTFKIVGKTPLIVHQFSEKCRKQIEDKQQKKAAAAKGKDARNPEEEYLQSIYWFEDNIRSGFPAVGFKAAMVRTAKNLKVAPMTDFRTWVFVVPDEGELIEIKGEHHLRTDNVRIGNGVSDIRYRAEYTHWECTINIDYNDVCISPEQIKTILHDSGFGCGIGEWRPEKSNSGQFGTWKVV